MSNPNGEKSLLKTAQFVRPYLLNNLKVTASNQVWQTDITYIRLNGEYIYLVAFIDVYSRYITGWGLFDSLKSELSIETMFRAIYLYGNPNIINTDQGSQYVCDLWIRFLEREGIKISMNEKGKPTQNIFIERLWKTIKYNFLFLREFSTIEELEKNLAWFVNYYNYERTHKGIGEIPPALIYTPEKFIDAALFYQRNEIISKNMTNINSIFDLYEKHKLSPVRFEDYIFLHFNQSEKPSLIVKIIKNRDKPLSLDDIRSEYAEFAKLANKVKCWQFRLVCQSEYLDECYSIPEFNIALSGNDYLKSLESFYHMELFAHNENTYRKIVEGFENSNRVAVVQATGTGKSLLISKLLLDNKDQQILVVAPSVYIIAEIKKHLMFASKKSITFATYAFLARSKKIDINKSKFDIIILDEFHRSGAAEWGAAIELLLKSNTKAKVLGTSATPIRYLDGARNMADEFFEGNVVQNISIALAIAQNILPTPVYVSALYSFDSDYNKLVRKIQKLPPKNRYQHLQKLRELRTNWNNSSGVPLILKKHLPPSARKILVFCKNIEHLQKIRSVVSKWFYATWSKRINIYELHSELNNKRVFSEFERQKEDELDILLVVDMLNEGIHTKGIDAIIMLRDTASPNVYYQQLGRCMSVKMDYTPVIFDLVNNFDTINVRDFVRQYEIEIQRIASVRNNLDIASQKFVIIDEVKDILGLYQSLSNGLEKWDVKFEMLQEFYNQNGHSRVLSSNKELQIWCNNQKKLYRERKLSLDRINKLNSLNFRWKYIDNSWNEAYEQLREYYMLNGNSRVSSRNNSFLAAWCVRQRKSYRDNQLALTCINKLQKLDFIWDAKTTQWNKMIARLADFYNKNGHSRVTTAVDKELHQWSTNVRKYIREGKLSELKLVQLAKFDFKSDVKDSVWELMYKKLLVYTEMRGNTLVPISHDKILASWVLTQRVDYKHNRLKSKRLKKLEAIGFVWNVEEYLWENKFNEMKYHLSTTKRNKPLVSNNSMYYWYKEQRIKKREGKLSSNRIKRLHDIGLDL